MLELYSNSIMSSTYVSAHVGTEELMPLWGCSKAVNVHRDLRFKIRHSNIAENNWNRWYLTNNCDSRSILWYMNIYPRVYCFEMILSTTPLYFAKHKTSLFLNHKMRRNRDSSLPILQSWFTWNINSSVHIRISVMKIIFRSFAWTSMYPRYRVDPKPCVCHTRL